MNLRRNRRWMAQFVAAAAAREVARETARGVGTGVGGGDDPALIEATLWVNRSVDCPEAPAQAHLPREVAREVEGRRS
jgi:hypothetical protein